MRAMGLVGPQRTVGLITHNHTGRLNCEVGRAMRLCTADEIAESPKSVPATSMPSWVCRRFPFTRPKNDTTLERFYVWHRSL